MINILICYIVTKTKYLFFNEALFISKLSRPMLKAASGISCEGRCLTLKMIQLEISMTQQSVTYKQRLESWMRASKSTFMDFKGEISYACYHQKITKDYYSNEIYFV